jgi:uncharacterized protein DUF5654
MDRMSAFKEEFGVRSSHYIIGGVSIVAALSWNKAIKSIINNLYPLPKDNAFSSIIYALIMTIFVIFIIYILPDTKDMLPENTQNKIIKEQQKNKS